MSKLVKMLRYGISIIVFSVFSITLLYNLIPMIQNPNVHSERKECIREEFLRIQPVPSSVKLSEHTFSHFTHVAITTDYFVETDIQQIDAYYRTELTQAGWKETSTHEENTLNFIKGKMEFQVTRERKERGVHIHTGIYYNDRWLM